MAYPCPGPAPRENVKRGSLRLRSASRGHGDVITQFEIRVSRAYAATRAPGWSAGAMRLRYVGGDPDLTRIPHPERYEHPHPETEPPAPLRSATPRS